MKLNIILFEQQGKDNVEQMALFLKLMNLKEFPHRESNAYLDYVKKFMKFAKFFRDIEQKLGSIPKVEDIMHHKKEIMSA